MATISADTFNALNRYVSVRLRQGIPILDSDWNEQEDIRRLELRAFVKWFIGDGCPANSDAFRILVPREGMSNNFRITGARQPTGLRASGRIFCDGWDVTLFAEIAYDAQPLVGASAQVLTRQGATRPIAPLSTPTADGVICVYLDVWEHLVDAELEPRLVHRDLGTETCARIERRWAVRTRSSTAAPARNDADAETGHSYYALATIARRQGDPGIHPGDITDLRATDLAVIDTRAVLEALDVTLQEYRSGRNRPGVSLRESVNALHAKTLPGLRVAPLDNQTALGAVRLAEDATLIVEPALDSASRLGTSLRRVTHGEKGVERIEDLGIPLPDATLLVQAYVPLHGGEFLAVYFRQLSPSDRRLYVRRSSLGTLSGAREREVAAGFASSAQVRIAAVQTLDAVVIVIFSQPGGIRIFRYQISTNTASAVGTTIDAASLPLLEAACAVDGSGVVNVAFTESANPVVLRLLRIPTSGSIESYSVRTGGSAISRIALVADAQGNLWAPILTLDLTVWRFDARARSWEDSRSRALGPSSIASLAATVSRFGTLWIFYGQEITGRASIGYELFEPVSRAQSAPRLLAYLPVLPTALRVVSDQRDQVSLLGSGSTGRYCFRFFTAI